MKQKYFKRYYCPACRRYVNETETERHYMAGISPFAKNFEILHKKCNSQINVVYLDGK